MPRDGAGLVGVGGTRSVRTRRRWAEALALALVGVVVLTGCYSKLPATPTPRHLAAGTGAGLKTPASIPTKAAAPKLAAGGGGGAASPTPKSIGLLGLRTPTKAAVAALPTTKTGQIPAKPIPAAPPTPTPMKPTPPPTPSPASSTTATTSGGVLVLKSDPQGTAFRAPALRSKARGPIRPCATVTRQTAINSRAGSSSTTSSPVPTP